MRRLCVGVSDGRCAVYACIGSTSYLKVASAIGLGFYQADFLQILHGCLIGGFKIPDDRMGSESGVILPYFELSAGGACANARSFRRSSSLFLSSLLRTLHRTDMPLNLRHPAL